MPYRLVVLVLLLQFTTVQSSSVVCAQSASDLGLGAESEDLKLGALLGYNFNGGESWANLQPEVFVGFDQTVGGKWRLKVGPTFSSGGNTTDSTSFFRSLMLPGNASVSSLLYWQSNASDDATNSFYVALGLGLKAITGKVDTTESVAQHNVRLAGGYRLGKSLIIASQYTIGWHNLTNESEVTFKRAFGSDETRAEYLMISLQSYLPKAEMFLDITWRVLTNPGQFPKFSGQNRIIGIGVRKDLVSIIAPAANPPND